ncbi:oligosaccharide flippase family protein [uncultured Aeromicrobium sp.]|uniref:oligosaccharide flippase family protein n=1 Tax=uncultured Aeromicrobium sp. TaxID=337820 RepID=UPI0025D40483|nr:oligosaccharide flippase family protein [uncultured Aeromicrobium sp.]
MKRYSGLSGISSSAAVGVFSLLAGLLLLPLIFTTVGDGPYGAWLVLIAVVTYFQYTDLGVGTAIVHFGSRARGGETNRTLGQYLSAGLLWNAVAALIALPVFAVLALLYVSSPSVVIALDQSEREWLVALAVVALSSIAVRPFISTLTGAGLLPVDRRNQAIAVLLRVTGTLLVCWLHPSVVLLAAVETLALVLPALIAALVVKRRKLARLRWDRSSLSTLKAMLGFSMKSFTVGALGAMILQSGTILSGTLLGPQAAAHYGAAFRVYSAARQVLTWVVDPFRSTLSRAYVAEPERAKELLNALAFVVFLASAVSSTAVCFVAPWLVDAWLGPDVPDETITLAVIVLFAGLAVNSLQMPLAPAGDAAGRPGVFAGIQLLWLTLNLVIAFVFAPQLGIPGVALGLTAPLIVIVPLYILRARATIGLELHSWRRRAVAPVLVGTSPAIAVAVVVSLGVVGHVPEDVGPLIVTASYLIAQLLTLLILRRRLPLADVLALIRSEL